MANLSFFEKDCFEQLFNLGSGYVLDFTNRTFQEFVYDILEIDIYAKYSGLSKAKMLRSIIVEYDNVSAGKLLLHLLEYMKLRNMVNNENHALFKKCADIGNRLIGKTVDYTQSTKSETHTKSSEETFNYEKYIDSLKKLSALDNPQSRGFSFEKYLNEFFEDNNLQPRSSFKLVGEQIDGSFILHNEVYLLEAKWTSKPIDKSNLIVFNEKVSSKSRFTRGLYISYSEYSKEAIKTFSSGRTVSIVLMTVQEIAICLSQKRSFNDFLWAKIRALAEEGNFNKSIFEI